LWKVVCEGEGGNPSQNPTSDRELSNWEKKKTRLMP